MKREYLGDSYDAVKRLWQEVLSELAPLHAEPKFIPEEIRDEFTALTRIPMLNGIHREGISILNDPDTGIRAPARANQREGRSHISLSTIKSQLERTNVRCVVTFDQSNHRSASLPSVAQRQAKIQWLQNEGCFAFYYASHAPFLFAFSSSRLMQRTEELIAKAGIPNTRLERAQ